jgi:hypothetical protein
MTWRERRILSYAMHEFDDVNLPYEERYDSDESVIETVVDFFKTESTLIYPAKSYFVAIVYAKMLEKHFGIDFLKALDEGDLLPDDDWFKPYHESKEIYDTILDRLPGNILDMPSTEKTKAYFREEFLIGTDL